MHSGKNEWQSFDRLALALKDVGEIAAEESFETTHLGERYAAAYVHLAAEYLGSICHLASTEHYSTSLVLLRPTFEAVVSFNWFKSGATADQIESFNTLGKNPKIGKKLTDLSRAEPEIASALRFAWEQYGAPFHDYTHGGPAQISRRIDDSSYIGANFDRAAIESLQQACTGFLVLVAAGFSDIIGDVDRAIRILSVVANRFGGDGGLDELLTELRKAKAGKGL